METLKLSQLIGTKILEIRSTYLPENEYGQQQFNSYLKLSNGYIIDIPIFDSEDFLELSTNNLIYFKSRFDNAIEFPDPEIKMILGQTLEDIYFCYYDDKIMGDERTYIKLANQHFLTEVNFGPPGIGIGLLIYNYNELIENARNRKQQLKSYVERKNFY